MALRVSYTSHSHCICSPVTKQDCLKAIGVFYDGNSHNIFVPTGSIMISNCPRAHWVSRTRNSHRKNAPTYPIALLSVSSHKQENFIQESSHRPVRQKIDRLNNKNVLENHLTKPFCTKQLIPNTPTQLSSDTYNVAYFTIISANALISQELLYVIWFLSQPVHTEELFSIVVHSLKNFDQVRTQFKNSAGKFPQLFKFSTVEH